MVMKSLQIMAMIISLTMVVAIKPIRNGDKNLCVCGNIYVFYDNEYRNKK